MALKDVDHDFERLLAAGRARVEALQRQLDTLDGAGIARELRRTYGYVDEVIFLTPAPQARSILVFQDGTGLLCGQETYLPFTFGYAGQGPTAFARLLEEFDFPVTETTSVVPPLRLRADGTREAGERSGDTVVWSDGSETEVP